MWLKICDSHPTCKVANKCLNVRERVEVVEWNKKWSPPFPCCPVSRQCPWKKTLIEKKSRVSKEPGTTNLACYKLTHNNINKGKALISPFENFQNIRCNGWHWCYKIMVYIKLNRNSKRRPISSNWTAERF